MVWISHVYFIRSLVYGHLGCFHLGSIMNGAAVHIQQALRRHMFSFPLGIYLGVDLLSSKRKKYPPSQHMCRESGFKISLVAVTEHVSF